MQKSFSELRKEAGFESQEKFCIAAGLERGSVAKWETGTSYPRALMLPKLATILNVSEGDIIAAIATAREKANHHSEQRDDGRRSI